jgi:hypothetical protein
MHRSYRNNPEGAHQEPRTIQRTKQGSKVALPSGVGSADSHEPPLVNPTMFGGTDHCYSAGQFLPLA